MRKFKEFIKKGKDGFFRMYESLVNIHAQRPTVYRDSPYNKKITKLQTERNLEINELQVKIQNVRRKYSNLMREIKKDSIKDIQKMVFSELIGKIIQTYKTISINDNYHRQVTNEGMFIDKIINIECYEHNRKVEIQLDNGEIVQENPVYVKIFTKNNGVIEEPYTGLRLLILDDLLRFLEKNIGREFSFSGVKLTDYKNVLEKNVLEKKVRPSNNPHYTFTNNCKKQLEVLNKFEIINIPKCGDFILINDEYLFYYLTGYKFVSREISGRDPYGEEDWEDESEEQQEIFRKRHGINQNYIPMAMYPEDENEYDQGDWDDVGWGEDA